MVETNFAFGFFKDGFNGPSHTAETGQRLKRGGGWSIAHIGFQFPQIALAPQHHPDLRTRQAVAHRHHAHVFVYVLEGRYATQVAGGERMILKPGEIFYATAGRGTATHLTSELFNMMAGTKLMAVHYRGGGDTIKDLLSGQVKVMFSSIAPVINLVKEGKLLALSTTGAKRDPAFPDVPTVAEAGVPDMEVPVWTAFFAPAKTPPAIVAKLQQEVARVVQTPEVRQRFAQMGLDPVGGTSEELGARVRRDIDKWSAVAKAANIRND